MSAFVIPGISICNEPLSEALTIREYDGEFAHTATIYKRHPRPEMTEGDVWAEPWLVFCALDDKLSRKVCVRKFIHYDDAEAAADTWVYHGEVPR